MTNKIEKKDSNILDLSREHSVRVAKVKEMQKNGIEPWPSFKKVDSLSSDVINEFKDSNEKKYSIAGRILIKRTHGQSIFAVIQDRAGKIQTYLKEDNVGLSEFAFFDSQIDIGDIVWICGVAFKTKTGEITLKVQNFTLLSKCLHPLPEKFHGIADIETKYRQRYLDLITDEDSRKKFVARSKIISELRRFLESYDFMEVETPMLHPIAGGAAAKPFITHHNALDSELYLRIAPELYLKRLVVGGFDRIYEINRNFRNEGVSTKHNPEFTMLEFYMAHNDYIFMMDFVESLLRNCAMKAIGSLKLPFGNYILDFEKPFVRLSLYDAVKIYGKFSDDQLSVESISNLMKELSIKMPTENASYGEKLFVLFDEVAEHHLIQPTFIIDYPIEVSPLAKKDENNPGFVARFELFMAAMEISNCFNELNDPFDQAERFIQQAQNHEDGDDEAHRYDADFIKSLQYAMPPTVGCGIGIDRLVMLLTNTTSIKDVILFPTLKKKQ